MAKTRGAAMDKQECIQEGNPSLQDGDAKENILEHFNVSDKQELLDYADLIYRLDWAFVQCYLDQKPFSLDGGLIRQQKDALEKALNFDPLHYYKEGSLEVTDK